MKAKSKTAKGKKQITIFYGAGLRGIHKELKAMVLDADYDFGKLRALQKKVDPVTADQIEAVMLEAMDPVDPDYAVARSTGEVSTKFTYGFTPLHKAIRFKGHEGIAPVRITIKKTAVANLYNVIAPALLKAGVRPFLVFNDNAFLVLPKDKLKAQHVIAKVG